MLLNYGREIPPYEQDIARIGCIQNHGFLIALEEENFRVVYASDNIEDLFGLPPQELLGQNVDVLISRKRLKQEITKLSESSSFMIHARLKSQKPSRKVLPVSIHRNLDNLIILEFENNRSGKSSDMGLTLELTQEISKKLKVDTDLQRSCETLAQEIKRITQFDRVMIYQYDQEFNGQVIAEAKNAEIEPFLGLHFPKQDTQFCLEILEEIWSRMIPDVQSKTIPILSDKQNVGEQSLNLTHSILRGHTSCHQEYLKNMGVGASLVLSLKKEGKLWGLVSCHHSSPKYISPEVRQVGEFICQLFSIELSTKTDHQIYEYRVESSSVQSQLLAFMGRDHTFIDGLVNHKPNLLDLVNAQGAAIFWNGSYITLGLTPEEKDITQLIEWLDRHLKDDLFYTQCLSKVYPQAEVFEQISVGLLAVHISKENYLLWFRPEVLQTITWGGNPYEKQEIWDKNNQLKLLPRNSFEAWKEIIRGTSLPWENHEIEAAKELRKSLIHIILNQVDELSKLTRELERSNAELEKFAYIASHDLQEPLNLIASYVELLEMRYEDQFDQEGKDFLGFVVEGVSHMQGLIDDLLTYSRVGRKGQKFVAINAEDILKRSLVNLQVRIAEVQAKITYDSLPDILGDTTQLTQLFQNLISNALKFHRDNISQVHIGVREQREEWLFSVQDNGIGIEKEMADRIFTIFQRLHTREEYEGTGIGLAICKKIVEVHGGKIWVESEVGQGSTFYFTIPKQTV
ncbi:MAG: GAF domain-containing protein [Roseofilum sp. SID2]|uniref:ATP-binding protein n=1 Tax=unclassified Roseofilum TaxID=2620099 RepID=UPI001B03C366|nr:MULTISPECIES: ATP-binding protein [unclassified Roseofilum]MBP0013574.1 GAF domain-containing protein [Roseofilum sp. SID3]MBP0023100.1 GAF domain-containing protein [Roseofilum sp. SID2]MBP0038356.1 GAF domain-containing protein [Roseofilum sp. SID1]